MKKTFFIIFTLPCLLFSQQYLPLAVEGNIWSVSHQKFFALGDTILGGKAYKKIYYKEFDSIFSLANTTYICGIRDSSDGRTYFRPRLESSEEVLYDWNLNTGDSILMFTYVSSYQFFNPANLQFYDNMGFKDVVTNVDSVFIYGLYRKRIQFYLYGWTMYWIEGVGGLNGLFYNSYNTSPVIEWNLLNLICFHHYDTLVYHNYMYGGDTNVVEDACYFFTTVGIDENVNSNITIYPNPANDYLFIHTQESEIDNYFIFSTDGKYTGSYPANGSINISQLSSGLYFICNEKRTWFGKFIKN